MDEFDIYLESAGSMKTCRQNTMACFRNVLAEPLQLEGDCRVVLADIIFPTSIKNISTKGYFVYTPKTPFNSSPPAGKTNSGGVMVEREDWSNNGTFPDCEYKTVKDVVTRLHVAVAKSTRLIVTSSTEEDSVEFNFADGYGISLHDRSLIDVLGFKGVLDPNRGGYFIVNNNKVKKQTQPIKGEYPADITAGTNILFVNCDIIEHQHIAGVKAPILRVIDTERRLTNGNLQITSATKHKSFLELQFKKLALDTIREIFIELVAKSGDYVPFVGTSRVAITLKFRKF